MCHKILVRYNGATGYNTKNSARVSLLTKLKVVENLQIIRNFKFNLLIAPINKKIPFGSANKKPFQNQDKKLID